MQDILPSAVASAINECEHASSVLGEDLDDRGRFGRYLKGVAFMLRRVQQGLEHTDGAASLVVREVQKLVAKGQQLFQRSACSSVDSTDTCAVRSFNKQAHVDHVMLLLLSFLQLLACLAFRLNVPGVRDVLHSAQAAVCSQIRTQTLLFERLLDGLLHRTACMYEVSPVAEKFKMAMLELQACRAARGHWHIVNEGIVGRLAAPLVRVPLQQMVEMSEGHCLSLLWSLESDRESQLPPRHRGDDAVPQLDMSKDVQQGRFWSVLANRCPESAAIYALRGESQPVCLHPCRCMDAWTWSKRAARKSNWGQQCCMCKQFFPHARFVTDVQAMWQQLAVLELPLIERETLSLEAGIKRALMANATAGTYRGAAIEAHLFISEQTCIRNSLIWKAIKRAHYASYACAHAVELVGFLTDNNAPNCEGGQQHSAWLVYKACSKTLAAVIHEAAKSRASELGGLPLLEVALLVLELSTACCTLYSVAALTPSRICPATVLVSADQRIRLYGFSDSMEPVAADAPGTQAQFGAGKYSRHARYESSGCQLRRLQVLVHSIAATAVAAACGNVVDAVGDGRQLRADAAGAGGGGGGDSGGGAAAVRVPESLPAVLRGLLVDMGQSDEHKRPGMEEVRLRALAAVKELGRSCKPSFIKPMWPDVFSAVHWEGRSELPHAPVKPDPPAPKPIPPAPKPDPPAPKPDFPIPKPARVVEDPDPQVVRRFLKEAVTNRDDVVVKQAKVIQEDMCATLLRAKALLKQLETQAQELEDNLRRQGEDDSIHHGLLKIKGHQQKIHCEAHEVHCKLHSLYEEEIPAEGKCDVYLQLKAGEAPVLLSKLPERGVTFDPCPAASLSDITQVCVQSTASCNLPLVLSQMRKHCHLRSLDLERQRPLSHNSASALVRPLGSLTSLHHLTIRGPGLGPAGAVALAPALWGVTGLCMLRMSSTKFGSMGACAIAKPLAMLTALTALNLSGNDMDVAGATVLAPALVSMRQLLVLGLERNNIGDAGLAKLAGTLNQLRGLTQLRMRENGISEAGQRLLGPVKGRKIWW